MKRLSPPALHGILAALLLCCAVFGVVQVAAQRQADDARQRYNGLVACSSPLSDGCWVGVPARVAFRDGSHLLLGPRHNILGVDTAGGPIGIEVEPVDAYRCLTAGEPVTVKSWRGQVTAVLTPGGVIPTPANPNVAPTEHLEAASVLLAVSVIVPLGAVVAIRRARRHPVVPVLVQLQNPLLRFAAILFGAGQLADVVTSAAGQRAGLIEGNALVADFIDRVGPFGFLLFRLPLLVLALIAVFRLPRVVAVGVLLGCGIYFSGVGLHNMQLVLAASAAPGGCGGPALH